MSRRTKGGAAAVALMLLLPACGGASSHTPAADSSSAPGGAPDPSRVKVKLVHVADVSSPVAMAVRPNDDAIYVAEKTGRVRVVPKGQTASPGAPPSTPVLDLSGQVSTGTEQGLLGLTFSPDGSKLYVDYTDRDGNTQVVEYGFKNGQADPSTRRVVLSVNQPYPNHNGGEVVFGPDGKLYIGLGDGGSEGDPDGRGQNLGTLLAKILRIDPTPSGGKGYTVPSDNPFPGRSGAAPETWMYGLRNPWRFSFDRTNKDLWIGDVGQDKYEEVDYLPAGAKAGDNFGWSLMEASHSYKGSNPPGGVLPIFEYPHSQGCSITGGYVYRGSKIASLQGIYVYGDACAGTVWGLTQQGGKETDQAKLDVSGGGVPKSSGFSISSFGEDGAGELYLLDLAGGLFRLESS